MIKGLDGVRAIAFLLVFAFHTNLLLFGWIGVELFFVLSGFLITGILVQMKETLGAREYFTDFYGRRALRIFPLYFVFLFAILLASFIFANSTGFLPGELGLARQQLPFALTYTYDFFHSTSAFRQSTFLSPLWSLSIEEQFYLIWPCVVLLTPRKHLKLLLVVLVLAGPLFRGLELVVHQHWESKFVMPSLFIYVLPFSHFDALAIGGLVTLVRFPKPKTQLLLLTLLLPAIGILTQAFSPAGIQPLRLLGHEAFLSANFYRPIWGYSLLNYYFALVICGVAFNSVGRWLLELAPLRFMGRISYGLYVFHLPSIAFVAGIGYWPLRIAMALLVNTGLATVSYFCLERPCLRLKDRYFPIRAKPGLAKAEPVRSG